MRAILIGFSIVLKSDRRVEKAIEDIEDARAEIAKAGLAADTP